MWTLKSHTTKRLTAEEVQARREPVGRLLQLELTITFTDGTQDITVATFVSTEAEITSAIKQNLDRLNAQAELEAKIAGGTFDPLAVAPEPEQTPEEIAAAEAQAAKAEWQRQRRVLKQMREDMLELRDLGLAPSEEQVADMTAIAQWLQVNAKAEYYD